MHLKVVELVYSKVIESQQSCIIDTNTKLMFKYIQLPHRQSHD